MTEKKDEGPRSFVAFLRDMADGEAEQALSNELHKLVKACQDEALAAGHPMKGALTLKLAVQVDTKGVAQIGYDVQAKAPKRRPAASVAWVTKGGNLTLEIPRQEKLPLRDVSTPVELRDVKGA